MERRISKSGAEDDRGIPFVFRNFELLRRAQNDKRRPCSNVPSTEDGHGRDISSRGQDELDIRSRETVRQRVDAGNEVYAVDLGGGLGAHSVRMAEAGAAVTMIDLAPAAAKHFNKAVEQGIIASGSVRFVQKNFRDIADKDLPEKIDVLYSQRALHYVPYNEAKSVLSKLFNRMTKNGVVFISAAGLDAEYGKTYPDRDKPVEERFSLLAEDMQKKHGVTHELVLYKEEDMARLLETSGFRDIKITRSGFGSIRATACK
ncbi:MAG: methyltransferase domain-containing protein [Pseudomonadota bacterium]